MLTEQELQEALAAAVEDEAAERFTIGLSDRALAEADGDSWLRRTLSGRRGRWVPFAAVGSALAVVAAVGVVVVRDGGGSDSSAASGSLTSLKAPKSPAHPLGGSAVTEFGVVCFDPNGPKLNASYVWDPATRQYRGLDDDTKTTYQASPDGKRALVVHGAADATDSWGVADWSDAIAGRVTQHPTTDRAGVHWSADGREVVGDIEFTQVTPTGMALLKTMTADYYDPSSGRRLASLALPQQVIDMATSGKWVVQQWQGDHDSAIFPMLSVDGNQVKYLDARGNVVRTLALQEGLPQDAASMRGVSRMSSDGRYLAEYAGSVIAVFDLGAGGKRIGSFDGDGFVAAGWIGDHMMMSATDTKLTTSGHTGDQVALTGHSLIYTVMTPDFKPVQQAKFVLPADPNGACSTWPMSWAAAGQFPGAFVP